MFTKQEIKDRIAHIRHEASLNGGMTIEAELNLAIIILGSALFHKKLRGGEDYAAHPLTVATSYTRSKNKRIIGILHDVVEDSDWTIQDLRDVGFSERIVRGVDGVTKRPGEKYFDFIVRCSLSGDDALDVKINDLHHNMDGSRYRHVDDNPKNRLKQKAYNIAYHYLVDIKKLKEDGVTNYNYRGTSMIDYIKSRAEFAGQPSIINELMDAFSTETERLPMAPSLGQAFGPRP
jgi:hypothetical protein